MKSTNKLNKVNILFLLKTGIGSAIAIILAQSLGLAYSPSAGIITLLTIQNTKKETIYIALRRFTAFIIAVSITYVMFRIFGYSAFTFGGIIFLFAGVCSLLGLKDGLSMNAVLMTHFLIEKTMDISFILNEVGLLVIGMVIGIMLNLIMPRYRELIRRDQILLEEEIKATLRELSHMLQEKDSCLIQNQNIGKRIMDTDLLDYSPNIFTQDNMKDSTNNITKDKLNDRVEFITEEIAKVKLKDKLKNDFKDKLKDREKTEHLAQDEQASPPNFIKLEHMLDNLLKKAYEDAGNTLQSNTKYLVSYLEMRKLQIEVLKNVAENIKHIPVILRQTYPIAEFLENIAESFHELNNVKGLLKELEELQEHYRREPLPITREEFEYRAILYQILKELEYFLLLKRNFIKELENKNMKSYWSPY